MQNIQAGKNVPITSIIGALEQELHPITASENDKVLPASHTNITSSHL
jgi:hypothetical protein